jgi:hypothetical protein
MAGKIAALFGGKKRSPDTNPAPGIGGYALGPGPTGDYGYPGSTSQTRTYKGNNPRVALVRADTNTGFEQQLSGEAQDRQQSYRGDIPGANISNPRLTPNVTTRQPLLTDIMQSTPGTLEGGPMLKTGPGNDTAGGRPGRRGAATGGHDPLETQTLWARAQQPLGGQAPGAENVRNETAQRYKNAPGQVHTYRSAARADQAPLLRSGQAADGNVHPDLATSEVAVPNRFVFPGATTTFSVLRQMPYNGRGDGARGAQLNGHRYYASGQAEQFLNAGQGDYGIARAQGLNHRRPVGFQEPAPWTANFYDTTAQVQDQSAPQAPDNVYVSPQGGRASNNTGRSV